MNDLCASEKSVVLFSIYSYYNSYRSFEEIVLKNDRILFPIFACGRMMDAIKTGVVPHVHGACEDKYGERDALCGYTVYPVLHTHSISRDRKSSWTFIQGNHRNIADSS